jgi:hypothetical protein
MPNFELQVEIIFRRLSTPSRALTVTATVGHGDGREDLNQNQADPGLAQKQTRILSERSPGSPRPGPHSPAFKFRRPPRARRRAAASPARRASRAAGRPGASKSPSDSEAARLRAAEWQGALAAAVSAVSKGAAAASSREFCEAKARGPELRSIHCQRRRKHGEWSKSGSGQRMFTHWVIL